MQQPHPFTPTQRPGNSNPFARAAALVSWLTPLAAIGLNVVGWAVASMSPQPELNTSVLVLTFGMSCILLLTGMVMGVIAFCGMMTHGRKGIFAPALAGVTLCISVAVASVIVTVPALKRANEQAENRRKSLADVKESVRELNDEAHKEIGSRAGSNSQTRAKLSQLQKSLENAAQNMSGGDALAMKASAAHTEKLTALMTNYDAAVAQLTSAKVLKPQFLQQKEDLAPKREVVQNFLDVNDRLKAFFQHGADNYRAELDRLQVPQNYADQALQGYNRKADLINPLIVEMREQDEVMGKAMLQIISMEETNWGHWQASETTGKIRFEDTALAADYNVLLKKIRQAGADQAMIKRRILDRSSTSGLQ